MRRLLMTTAFAAVTLNLATAASASAMIPGPHGGTPAAIISAGNEQPSLTSDVAAARSATAKYVTDLALAKANGYQVITPMMPNMGIHFLNPTLKGFDVSRPPILVYEHRGNLWQLGALEWVFTSKPATPPLPGAQYGTFGAACHYVDGTFFFAASQSKCTPTNPQTGAKFSFWHPNLITLHFWVWYPNPAGIYSGTNPLVAPFNAG